MLLTGSLGRSCLILLIIEFLWLVRVADCGLYAESPHVVELRGRQIWEENPEAARCPVLIVFYATWCPHCQHFAPTYSKLATRVEESPDLLPYTIAAVDCAKYDRFCGNYDVQYFPKIVDFPNGDDEANKTTVDNGLAFHDGDALWNRLTDESPRIIAKIGRPMSRNCEGIRLQLEKLNKKHGVVKNQTWIPNPDRVWRDDLKRALHQALTVDTVRMGVFSENRSLLPQLRSFMEVCVQAFPDEATRKRLADSLLFLDSCSQHPTVDDAENWTASLGWLEPPRSRDGHLYYGCRGSKPHTRGFTCALWQTFHSLLVNGQFSNGRQPHPGLAAVHNWIRFFFSCQDCNLHFMKLAKDMMWTQVSSDDDAVLWLWKAHNSVNRRLENSLTEDPARPKVQFPLRSVCTECWSADDVANHAAVLAYMRRFYKADAQWTGPEEFPPVGTDHSTHELWMVVSILFIIFAVICFCACSHKRIRVIDSGDMQLERREKFLAKQP
jgi:thiol-disulfide isomerase/thioredoxin